MLRDNTLKVLEGDELYNATYSADLILPGEWPCWGASESTVVAWAAEQKGHFIQESMHADQLLVAGFGCGDPDRAEFEAIIDQLPKFRSVKVVNPNPPESLLSTLEKVAEGEIDVSDSPL